MNSDPPHRGRPYSLNRHRLPGFDYADRSHAYFVTACARQGSPFTDPRLAQEVIASLHWLRTHRGLYIYAYCLMPDHLHLLLQLGEDSPDLSGIMRAFKTYTTRQSWRVGYHGALWQPRFHDHIVRRSEDGRKVAEYIVQNPVRKGLVREADAYVWSGMPDPL